LRLRAVAAVVAERRADAAEPHRQAPEGKIKRPKLSIAPDPFAAAREARIRERFGEKAYVRYVDEPLGSRAAFARDRASWKRTH
jgi:hypothetical protein